MKAIWAPWRIEYIRMKKLGGCILCDKPQETNDAQNLILFRGKKNYIIMNSYPYNPGHLMVTPYRHVARMEDLTTEERHEHIDLVSMGIIVIKDVMPPDGFNVGVNLGRVAGAGIDDHIHTHIVPRWNGDTNFMPVIGDVRVIPEALADTYQKLKVKF